MNSPIYKILNSIAKEYNVYSNLTDNSSFEEVSKVFENLLKVVDQETKRKIQFEYKLYAVSIQRQKTNTNAYNEYSSRDLAGIIKDYEIINKSLNKTEEPINLEPFMVNSKRFEDRNETFKTQKNHDKKQSKSMKKLIAGLIALGILAGASGAMILSDTKQPKVEPTSTVDKIDDTGEYNSSNQ